MLGGLAVRVDVQEQLEPLRLQRQAHATDGGTAKTLEEGLIQRRHGEAVQLVDGLTPAIALADQEHVVE